MPLAITALWTYTQERSLDTDATNPFLTLATDGYPLLNRAYRIVFNKSSRRNTSEDANTLGTFLNASIYGVHPGRIFLAPQNIAEILQLFYTVSPKLLFTCSASSGSVTMTTPTDFPTGGVLPGMKVSHANVPARTYVKSIESFTSLTLSDKTTGAISSATVNFWPTSGGPLQQEDYGRVLRLQQNEGTVGTPQIYGLRRAQAATLVGVGNIEIALYPLPANIDMYFPATVRYEIATLAAATDVVDVEDGEDYLIGDIVAYFSLVMQGRPEIASAILAELPDYYREAAIQAAATLPTKAMARA